MTGQDHAHARETAAQVIAAAEAQKLSKAGRGYDKMWRSDPLGWWFALAYLGRLALGFDECDHLAAEPRPIEHWDSASPTAVLCEVCVGPGRDDTLRADGLLPAYCGRCGETEATDTVSSVLDTIWILGRVCATCKATPPSVGSDAA